MEKNKRTSRQDGEAEQQVASNIRTVIAVFSQEGHDIRFAGSLGRAAAIKKDPISVLKDDSAKLRDLDVMVVQKQFEDDGLAPVRGLAQERTQGQFIDLLRPNGIIYDSNRATLRYRDVKQEVDPQTLIPHEGQIFGEEVPTFDPMTLFHMSLIHGYFRPKDIRNLLKYGRELRDISTFPNDAFDQYHDFYQIINDTYPFDRRIANLRRVYNSVVPQEVRSVLTPVLSPIMQRQRRGI